MRLLPAEMPPARAGIERRPVIVADTKGHKVRAAVLAHRSPARWWVRLSGAGAKSAPIIAGPPRSLSGTAAAGLLGALWPGPEDPIGAGFLLRRHRRVEVLERRDQLLQMLDLRLGNLLHRLHILHRVHRRGLLGALRGHLLHIASVFAHDLRELLPLRLLSRGDLQLPMEFLDAGVGAAGDGAGVFADCASAAIGADSSPATTRAMIRLARVIVMKRLRSGVS